MSPGIFISYSRNDEKQALHLLSILRREGYSVWIDQEAIAGASIWSDEIVQNIKRSEIFIALLSASSTSSTNVSKEIALAAEHGKIILPIEIGTVTLPGPLEYALAGIQRTNFHDEEAILRAIRSQVARLEGEEATNSLPSPFLRVRKLRRRAIVGSTAVIMLGAALFLFLRRSPDAVLAKNSVVVLPFATLNLDQDSTRNLDIFSEALLTRLSSLSELTTVGSSVSEAYKNSPLNALAIAKDLKARFIVDGLIRKSHDVNFVSVRLIDAKQNGEIWEQSYSGNNSELFTLRERVTNDIAGYLNAVSATEKEIQTAEQNLAAHPNDAIANAALAAHLLASDKSRAFELYKHAIELDSNNLAYYIAAGIVAEREGADPKEYGNDAVALCKKRMAQYPDSLDLTMRYAVALDLAGLGTRAETVYDSLLHLYPSNVNLNYNAACCLSRQGKADSSLDILQRLFTFAPGKKGEVLSDPDFDNIRSFPRYQKLMYGTP